MRRARLGAALLFVLALAAAAFTFAFSRQPRATPGDHKPTLLLLTSLPLVFGEGFSLEGGGSPALKALQSRYRVVPISVTSASELAKGRVLLMAHPQAQAAENLVSLDQWVRGGGRVVLLADPMLEWPSKRPLGDPLRPAPMFVDTGLLQHWGLRLDAPAERGPQLRKLAGHDVLTVSPGALSGTCAISADRLVARCEIGKGRATVVADADLLDTSELGSGASQNLPALLDELALLAPRRFSLTRVGKSQAYPQGSNGRTSHEQRIDGPVISRGNPAFPMFTPFKPIKSHCIPDASELPTEAVARGPTL